MTRLRMHDGGNISLASPPPPGLTKILDPHLIFPDSPQRFIGVIDCQSSVQEIHSISNLSLCVALFVLLPKFCFDREIHYSFFSYKKRK